MQERETSKHSVATGEEGGRENKEEIETEEERKRRVQVADELIGEVAAELSVAVAEEDSA
jgi:hypothetical protein